MDDIVARYMPVLAALAVAIVTSASTLAGVYLSQRAARKTQERQIEAAAELDEERRTHEARQQFLSREHEDLRSQWKRRNDAYAALLACTDEILLMRATPMTPERAAAALTKLGRHEYEVSLIAPNVTAAAALRLAAAAREAATPGQSGGARENLAQLGEAKGLFLDAARCDLGTSDNLRSPSQHASTVAIADGPRS